MKEIAYSRTALKALTRMPRNTAQRIRDKIRAFADNPSSQANNVTRLKGDDGPVRLRVGDWRVAMRDESVLQVLTVAGRGSVYRG
ncbi:MAG: type II toxin-antitoxin system RelE/ParE family toxin [Rhodospirillaceae bacterium]|nr:type II toxin-antitoxin system RelE/ParE family toxin [Rhodospirillaceae bacterium]